MHPVGCLQCGAIGADQFADFCSVECHRAHEVVEALTPRAGFALADGQTLHIKLDTGRTSVTFKGPALRGER